MSENNIKYIDEWQRKNVRRWTIKFNFKNDEEIISCLSKQENVNGYIKDLILNDLKNKTK